VIITPDVAVVQLLDMLLTHPTAYYHLYVSDITLGTDTTLPSFVEASFQGYSPQRAYTWIDAYLQGDTAVSYADPIVWTCSADGPLQTVYGYFVTNYATGPLLWCERRDAGGVPIQFAGDKIQVSPMMSWPSVPCPTLER